MDSCVSTSLLIAFLITCTFYSCVTFVWSLAFIRVWSTYLSLHVKHLFGLLRSTTMTQSLTVSRNINVSICFMACSNESWVTILDLNVFYLCLPILKWIFPKVHHLSPNLECICMYIHNMLFAYELMMCSKGYEQDPNLFSNIHFMHSQTLIHTVLNKLGHQQQHLMHWQLPLYFIFIYFP